MREYYTRCIPVYGFSVLFGAVLDMLVISGRAVAPESLLPFPVGSIIVVPFAAVLLSLLISLCSVEREVIAATMGVLVFPYIMFHAIVMLHPILKPFGLTVRASGEEPGLWLIMFLLIVVLPFSLVGARYGIVLLRKLRPPNQAL